MDDCAQRCAVATTTGSWPATEGMISVAVTVTPPCASVVAATATPGLACGENRIPEMNTLYGEFGFKPAAVKVATIGVPVVATAGEIVRSPLQLLGIVTGAGPAEAIGVGLLGVELAGVGLDDAAAAGGG